MSKRVRFPVFIIFLVTVFLLVSCVPDVAKLKSITQDPLYPKEGEVVTFTIPYSNSSSDKTLNEVVLEVNYDENLKYSTSDPQPVNKSEENHYLKWNLPSLQPGQEGAIKVSFELSGVGGTPIPIKIFELPIDVKFSGTTSQGNLSNSQQHYVTYILDHPTPTPTPMPVVEEYSDEGVTVELPWQNTPKIIHSEKRDFDFDPMTIPVVEGYSIIHPLIYLDIFDKDKNIVNDFSPSIILTVKYTANDIEKAGTADNLVILVFDREKGLWIPCDGKNDTEKTKCTITGNTQFSEEKGYGTISISIDAWTSGAGWGKR